MNRRKKVPVSVRIAYVDGVEEIYCSVRILQVSIRFGRGQIAHYLTRNEACVLYNFLGRAIDEIDARTTDHWRYRAEKAIARMKKGEK